MEPKRIPQTYGPFLFIGVVLLTTLFGVAVRSESELAMWTASLLALPGGYASARLDRWWWRTDAGEKLTQFFKLEVIDGGARCPVYLYRWILLRAFGCAVYLHKFVGEDWSLDLHDHPRRFISIGLRGFYFESTPHPTVAGWTREVPYHAPWIRSFPAEHVHRVWGPTPEDPCWTLVIVLPISRAWGFWSYGEWVHWKQYVAADNKETDKRVACR